MSSNLIRIIKSKGYDVIGYGQNQTIYQKLNNKNIKITTTILQLINNLEKSRTIILLVPSG
ncbi:6-phosphogluconate dehydrogenase-like protein [Mycoplasma putrefaciens]|nr:6-phosphogluconate dehydrogenase-like protein [Mycoplasma putrefaciens]